MTPFLLKYICEPDSKAPLVLAGAVMDEDGNIHSGNLVAPSGRRYPIINGIPRFVETVETESVTSFGDEWNHFNFTDFKINWLQHTVKNTFGSAGAFKDTLIVDAGGGSGAQTKWFSEYGAKHVIMLDLSHSVDDVVRRNLAGLKNVDVIQCSIDAPPLLDQSIDGMVYCHNVIQHTPSVEKTAHALYGLVAPGGEFVFNCYGLNDQGVLRWGRWHLIYLPLRAVLSRMPFRAILFYAHFISLLRMLPGLGGVLEKLLLCVQGDVPKIEGETRWSRIVRRYKAACLNTFDAYGSHQYQHHKTDAEIRTLVATLQPDVEKVLNAEEYFARPPKIGCALRVFR
ncbi:methyltransferase domain-containing protein [Rhodoferax mekongensis]|uniref:Methyltransferase domain-containing protein n=1 Tax=Rhodoferax mekongensis TaxID=3068341 RepID=A0ABZ0B1R2_9BURK|nr:methyltransferase domain-containing protein [Rhodoferax sp. TBRC 17307]WNO05826.1 methyltransferase domain-containing protein [Rhodoferax sp. TBRC 17307]